MVTLVYLLFGKYPHFEHPTNTSTTNQAHQIQNQKVLAQKG